MCETPTHKFFVMGLCRSWKLLEIIREKILDSQEGAVQSEGKQGKVDQSRKGLT